MDLDYLTTFLEIAKQGSFSRAGQKLFRSQPAVSAQIRQLEEEYGPKLFDRVGKSMKLTAAGEVLLDVNNVNPDIDKPHRRNHHSHLADRAQNENAARPALGRFRPQ